VVINVDDGPPPGADRYEVTMTPDATAPTVQVPGAFAVEATGPSGATASWSATATDPDDPAGPVSCSLSSGSTLLGTNLVSCSSTAPSSSSSARPSSAAAPATVPARGRKAASRSSSRGRRSSARRSRIRLIRLRNEGRRKRDQHRTLGEDAAIASKGTDHGVTVIAAGPVAAATGVESATQAAVDHLAPV
jgi:hypothetical protein